MSELIPNKLSSSDKIAFHHHVVEIEKMQKAGFPAKDWMPRKQIIENFCKRTGVNMDLLLKLVTHPSWKREIQLVYINQGEI